MAEYKKSEAKEQMFVSLILATVDRTEEVKRFLESLESQTYDNVELIVVDQNLDDRLVPILKPYRGHFPILHLRSERGLSRARNVGLKHISGDIVAFPDDDCWYPPDLLERVIRFFREHPDIDGLTGCSRDETGRLSNLKWDNAGGFVNKFNVWKRAVSYTIFLKSVVIRKTGLFDEKLGVGAGTPWGAGEEMDYLLRALENGARIYYDPNLVIFHPQPIKDFGPMAAKRIYTYRAGNSRVMRKHNFPLRLVLLQRLRTLIGVCLSICTGRFDKARYYLASLQGQIAGWRGRVE